MHKCKISNLYIIILDFCLFNTRSILVNSFFKNINFANNENNKKNFISKTIFKNNNQMYKTKTNIE